MRSLSDQSKARKQARNRLIISVFIVVLMVFSTVGYAALQLNGGASATTYNGHKFRPVIDQNIITGYTTKIDGKQVFFYTEPLVAAQINVPPDFGDALRVAPAIIVLFNPNDTLTSVYDQIRFDWQQFIPTQFGVGITQASDIYSFPISSCPNANQDAVYILLREGNLSITSENGCYVLSGSQYDFATLRDRVVYAYYGII